MSRCGGLKDAEVQIATIFQARAIQMAVYTTTQGVAMISLRFACAAVFATTGLPPAAAAAQPPTPTTAVLVNLTIKRDVDRTEVLKVMSDEVGATVKL
jgi:hypothetical protein